MGLLKHVVLPLYALLNLAVVFGSLVAEDLSDTVHNLIVAARLRHG